MVVRLLVATLGLAFSLALAQPSLKLGAVLSQSGEARFLGQAQARALEALSRDVSRRGYVQGLELLVQDDASNPASALREVRRLVEEEEVQALICCSTKAATAAVAAYVNEARVLTLALSDLPEGEPGFWLFTVKPDQQRLLQAALLHQAAEGQGRFGLMTLDNGFGDRVRSDLDLLIDPASGVQLVVDQRYPAGVTVLTPEALWVATRLPETVFVWGLASDGALAVSALGARGYGGEVMLNPDVLASGAGANLERLEGALAPVSPVAVAATLSPTHLTYGLTQDYLRAVPARSAPEGAYAYDALRLLQEALEQAYTYGVANTDLTAFRGLLRDAFIGMGAVAGASASFDYSESDHVGVLPGSLVLARLERGRLVYTE